MHIPDAVRSSVIERMRLFDSAEREIVLHASVIGRAYEVAVLSAVAAFSEERVRAASERACDLQLVAADPGRRDAYAFRHALFRDVVYAELVAQTLRPIHLRIVLALEQRLPLGENGLDGLAYHAWAAGDGPRCVRYNERAGDRAAAAFAHDDARTRYARALDASPAGSDARARIAAKLSSLLDSNGAAG